MSGQTGDCHDNVMNEHAGPAPFPRLMIWGHSRSGPYPLQEWHALRAIFWAGRDTRPEPRTCRGCRCAPHRAGSSSRRSWPRRPLLHL